MRWTTTLPNDADPASTVTVTLSPDGSYLAYPGTSSSGSQIFVRPLDQLEAKSVAAVGGTPFSSIAGFSPEAHWIPYFDFVDHKLKKVPVTGGAPIALCTIQRLRGASWGPDDTIIFADDAGGLSRVPAGGGTPQVLTVPDRKKGDDLYSWPEIMPDGQA